MPISTRPARLALAIAGLERFCERHVPGRRQDQTVDLLESPERSRIDRSSRLQAPERRLFDTLSDPQNVMAAVELWVLNQRHLRRVPKPDLKEGDGRW